MQGYTVVTLDDEELGTVVRESGDFVIVETGGRFRKSEQALPREYTEVESDAERVRTTISREIFEGSPKIEGELDEQVMGEYYGLREPAHLEGAEGAEQQGRQEGVMSAEEERARIREGKYDSGGNLWGSPGMLGDRLADTDPPKH